jgi:MOSC domain-containing protein YiiM
MQLNVMSSRAISLIAADPKRWALAGDQMYIDFDLSIDNLPTRTQLVIGEAVIEVTDPPHRGCQKFSGRFGLDALRFVNSEVGRSLRLRGLNARVVVAGTIRRGDAVTKLPVKAV